jgi:hypothetical protein
VGREGAPPTGRNWPPVESPLHLASPDTSSTQTPRKHSLRHGAHLGNATYRPPSHGWARRSNRQARIPSTRACRLEVHNRSAPASSVSTWKPRASVTSTRPVRRRYWLELGVCPGRHAQACCSYGNPEAPSSRGDSVFIRDADCRKNVPARTMSRGPGTGVPRHPARTATKPGGVTVSGGTDPASTTAASTPSVGRPGALAGSLHADHPNR